MKAAPLPSNESERLKALEQYQILDTLPEEVYDDITKIASEICGTPIALLTLIDEKRQWFKSKQGFDVSETPREVSFCAHAIINPYETMVVEDARYDERFHDNPLTTDGENPVVFYAGVPIVNADGHALGSLCVIDSRPRELTDQKLMALQALAKLVNAHFELRKTNFKINERDDKIRQGLQTIGSVLDGLTSINNQTISYSELSPNIDLLKQVVDLFKEK
jgi:GAF domain-containing protein